MDSDREQNPTVRRLRRLMLINLALSAISAVVLVVFSDTVVNYQLAHHLGAASGVAHPGSHERWVLTLTLLTRPLTLLVAALITIRMVRRLRLRLRGTHRRLILIYLLQAAFFGYLVSTRQYPTWLLALIGLQLVAVLAVLVTALRVRGEFTQDPPNGHPHRAAILTLLVLAPLFAEMSWGSTRITQAYGLLFEAPMYCAGALLIRELVRRRGGGWPAILLLGAAYGILEEGIALQSLTSPTLYPGNTLWAPRLFGVNSAYTVLVLPYHAIFSIALPILATELLFPGRLPYLARRGLIRTAIVFVAGVALLRVLIPPSIDAGYRAPTVALAIAVAVVIVLGVLALVVLPRRAARPRPTGDTLVPADRRAPRPWAPCVVAGLGTLAFLGLIVPLPGATQSGYTHGWAAFVPVLLAIAAAITAGAWLVTWARRPGWTPRHAWAMVAGALAAHTVIGSFYLSHTALDLVGLYAFGLVAVGLCVVGYRRVPARTPVPVAG